MTIVFALAPSVSRNRRFPISTAPGPKWCNMCGRLVFGIPSFGRLACRLRGDVTPPRGDVRACMHAAVKSSPEPPHCLTGRKTANMGDGMVRGGTPRYRGTRSLEEKRKTARWGDRSRAARHPWLLETSDQRKRREFLKRNGAPQRMRETR